VRIAAVILAFAGSLLLLAWGIYLIYTVGVVDGASRVLVPPEDAGRFRGAPGAMLLPVLVVIVAQAFAVALLLGRSVRLGSIVLLFLGVVACLARGPYTRIDKSWPDTPGWAGILLVVAGSLGWASARRKHVCLFKPEVANSSSGTGAG
jgi:hypothetical protein